jgi:hypothetical protein
MFSSSKKKQHVIHDVDFNRDYPVAFCQDGISAAGINPATQAGEVIVSIHKIEGQLGNGENYSAYVIGDKGGKGQQIAAYWVPQGGSAVIPEHPGKEDPKFVFTPSFSGCTWVLNRVDESTLLAQHLTGGKFNSEYSANREEKGIALSATRWRDYAAPDPEGKLTKKAAMFMRYEGRDQGWGQFWQTRDYIVGKSGQGIEVIGDNAKVVGHDYKVLTRSERSAAFGTVMAASASEHRRHGTVPMEQTLSASVHRSIPQTAQMNASISESESVRLEPRRTEKRSFPRRQR